MELNPFSVTREEATVMPAQEVSGLIIRSMDESVARQAQAEKLRFDPRPDQRRGEQLAYIAVRWRLCGLRLAEITGDKLREYMATEAQDYLRSLEMNSD